MLEDQEDEPLLQEEHQASVRFRTRFRKEAKHLEPKMASGTLVPSAAPATQVRWAEDVHQDPSGQREGGSVTVSAVNPTPSLHQAIAAYKARGGATLSLHQAVAACNAGGTSSTPGAPSLTDAVESFMAKKREAAEAASSSDPNATEQPQATGGAAKIQIGRELAARRSPRFERFSTTNGSHSPTGARSPRLGSPSASRSPIMKGREGTHYDATRDPLDNCSGDPRGMANCGAPPMPAGRFQRNGSRGNGARAMPVSAMKKLAPPAVEHPPVGDLLGDLIDLDNNASQLVPGAGGGQSGPLFEQLPLRHDRSVSSILASELSDVRM